MFYIVLITFYSNFTMSFFSKSVQKDALPTVQFSTRFNEELSTEKFNKWIVVTSINEPTKQTKKLSKEIGFKLLVVSDVKTNQEWFLESTIFLSVKKQKSLFFKSIKSTPFNSYTRKNIGYLYAIKYGAQFIYDTDDDNQPIMPLNDYFDFGKTKTELEYDLNSPLALNPYAHFGQPTIWPRGFPLDNINKDNFNEYICKEKLTSVVQQSVVDGDPDVDAIFRLTKSIDSKRIEIKFDSTSPSVKIPLFKVTPYNSQNTFFHYKAFWSLYLPHSVSFRLTDIWRSYWAQRLLWLLGSTVSFHGPNAYQQRNSHSYTKDYLEEKDMYLKTNDLIQFLYEWKCNLKRFYACVLDLSREMAVKKFWKMDELESIKNWLDDLDSVGYIEPAITNYEYETSSLNVTSFLKKSISHQKIISSSQNSFKLRYTPYFQTLIDMENYYGEGKEKMHLIEIHEAFKYFRDYCGTSYNLFFEFNKLKTPLKSNIVLLVTFSKEPVLENLIFLKEYHQSYFKNIVFCGKSLKSLVKRSQRFSKKFDSFTLIDFEADLDSVHHDCVAKVIDMNYKATSGILKISDDTLLKHWNLYSTESQKIWHTVPSFCGSNSNIFRKPLEFIDSIANQKSKTVQILKEFFQIYNKNVGVNSITNVVITEETCSKANNIFFLTQNLFLKFNALSRIFTLNNYISELTVPFILLGLQVFTAKKSLLNGLTLNSSQLDFNKTYGEIKHYAHNFDISHYKSSDKRMLICKHFIHDKFENF